MEINVLIEGLKGKLTKRWLKSLAESVLVAQGVSPDTELSLVIVNQEKIQELNRAYLGRNRPTDVLAFSMLPREDRIHLFPSPDGILHLGEIIISYPQAVIQAKEHHHSVKKEIAILTIHGLLHLLGYDHDKPELDKQMKAKEKETLGYIKGEIA
ncbi:MAG: rRNA maturation RNase YbeY [Chloroflexota bacterium]